MSLPGLILTQGDPATWPNPVAGKTAIGVNDAGAVCIKQSNGTVTVLGEGGGASVGGHKQSSSVGTVDILVTAAVWTEIISLTGVLRTIPIVIALTNIADFRRVTIKLAFPTLPTGSIIQLYSDTDLIATFTTDGLITSGVFNVYGDNGAWVLESSQFPAA